MLTLTSFLVTLLMQSATPVPPAPTTAAQLEALPLAQFRKVMPFLARHEAAGERIARQNDCKYPLDANQWYYARVQVAMLVMPDGSISNIIAQNSGCPELEDYVMAHITKYGTKAGPIPPSGKPSWYRTAMQFRWPERPMRG